MRLLLLLDLAAIVACAILFASLEHGRWSGHDWPSGICDTPECWRGR